MHAMLSNPSVRSLARSLDPAPPLSQARAREQKQKTGKEKKKKRQDQFPPGPQVLYALFFIQVWFLFSSLCVDERTTWESTKQYTQKVVCDVKYFTFKR